LTATRNRAASALARLLAKAKAGNRPFDEILIYYGIERFLYRLGRTPHAHRFVLKGALMLPLWGSSIARATRDIDMLGTTTMSPAEIEAIVRECMQVIVDPDGLEFLPDSIELSEIRKEERYGGTRATFQARMERTKIHLQLDVGFGDVVTPGPVEIHYPTLLEHAAPVLAGYTAVTAIAEKLSAIVDLGLANSRMKDYWDLWSISGALELHGPTLATAIAATFRRRGMPLPATQPPGLSDEFSADVTKRQQWNAFVRRLRVSEGPDLADVVNRTAGLLQPVLDALGRREDWDATWPPAGPWTANVDR
jgi:hypothetical protein